MLHSISRAVGTLALSFLLLVGLAWQANADEQIASTALRGTWHWGGTGGSRGACSADLQIEKIGADGSVVGSMKFRDYCGFTRVFGTEKPADQKSTVIARYENGRLDILWQHDGTRYILVPKDGKLVGDYYYVKGHYDGNTTRIAASGKVADGKCGSDCSEYHYSVDGFEKKTN